MSQSVTEARIQQYTSDVRLKLQQGASKLRGRVMIGTHTGKGAVALDQVGKVDMADVNVRHGQTQYSDTPHDRRWVYPQHKSVADLIDTEDRLELQWDPQGPYLQTQAAAAGRKIDSLVLAAAIGTAQTGETGSTAETWSATYQVVHGSTGMNVDKIKDALRMMASFDVDVTTEDLTLVIGSKQMYNLMNDTQYINLDYTGGPVLPAGTLKPFMNVAIMTVSDSLLAVASSIRSCVLFARSGVHLGIWQDFTTFVDRLPTLNQSTQVQGKMTMGATRLELGRVIEVQADET